MITIKSPEEIQKMRKAGALACKTLDYIQRYIKPGVTTLLLNDLCHSFITSQGGICAPLNYKGFPKSICTSVNNIVCHGIPSATTILKDGDIINVDVTTIVDGYHGDTSRTFFVGGKSSPNIQKLVERTYQAMWVGIQSVQPGVAFSKIGSAIQEYIKPFGYGIVRELGGHGIGKVFHEEPFIHHYATGKKDPKMLENMTFTIEPMINEGTHQVLLDADDGWTIYTKDNRWSAQFEHTVLVTDKGAEVLTLIQE